MSHKITQNIAIIAICIAVAACSTATESSSVAKIKRQKTQKIKVQEASFETLTAGASGQNITSSQYELVCNNEKMRVRAADNNTENDTARMVLLDDVNDNSSNVIGEILVNCRDYFTRNGTSLVPSSTHRTAQTHSPRIITSTPHTSTPHTAIAPRQVISQPRIAPAPSPVFVQPQIRPAAQTIASSYSAPVQSSNFRSSGKSHRVRAGDTLYRIARNNCTSVQDIMNLNNISDPRTLDVNDVISIPAGHCN